MSRWLLVVLLGLEAHFAASFLVPLDAASQREFGGLIRWFWPRAEGDGGPLGRVATTAAGAPLPALFLALLAGTVLLLGALAAAGWWVPSARLRPLAGAGAALLLVLVALFLGPTKLLPLAFAFATLYVAIWRPALLVAGGGVP